MTSAEIAGWAWVLVVMLTAALATMVILASTLMHLRRTRRLALEQRLRGLVIAAMTTDDHTAARDLRKMVLAHPLAGFDVLTAMLWLVRGAWKERLRRVVDDPEMLVLCRRWICRPRHILGGLAPQILGLAAHPDDLPRLAALVRHPGPVAGSAAIGIVHGWPVDHATTRSALARLEELRPDLLRALLAHLDRDAVQRQLPLWADEPAHLPLAVFVAGRLDLTPPPAAILTALHHPRAQVRRAACVAIRGPGQENCRRRLAALAEGDAEVLVRVAAVHALGRSPHPDNLPVLRRILDAGPWLVQSHVVPAILAHGDGGRQLLLSNWRSGAVRWIRELASETGAVP